VISRTVSDGFVKDSGHWLRELIAENQIDYDESLS